MRGVVGVAQAVGAVARQQPAAADQRDLLAELLGLLEVVRRQQHRRAQAVQAPDVAPEIEPQFEVDAGRRLVEDQQPRLVHQRPREQQPAAHSAGELRRTHAGLRAQVEDVHHLRRAPLGVRARHPVVPAVVEQVLLDVEEAVEVHVLLGESDHAPRLGQAVVGAEDLDLAGGDADQVADGADQRRLAGPVGPSRPKNEPSGISRSKSSSARKPPS